MKISRLGIAAAIMATFGFSCYNSPNYERVGMSNGPGGSGSATPTLSSTGPSFAATPAASPATAGTAGTAATPARPDSTKNAAKKSS